MTSQTTDLATLSFQEAIAFTQQWLVKVEAQSLSDEQVVADLTELLCSRNGVRGFFVAYLTGNSSLANTVPKEFFEAFRATATEISEIVVKNLAMSTAMAIAHERNGNSDQQAGSETVKARSNQLLKVLLDGTDDNAFEAERVALLSAVTSSEGKYAAFPKKWGYDAEQCEAITMALEAIAPKN